MKKAATRYIAAVSIILAVGFFPPWDVYAQTVLSPNPPISIPDYARPLIEPAGPKSDTDEEPVEENHFHIPLIFNDSVENQIEYFTSRGRAVFQAWLDRSARYLPVMKKIFRDHNLPEELVYVAMIESGFNPCAVSPKKATGFWQFMKATALEYGLIADHWVDERRDPIKSTRAACAHFKDLYNLFGSWLMVLASYNAGMGRMQGAVIKANSDDFWDLRSSPFIGAETQDYVPKYMAALIIAKNPVIYGFTLPKTKPFEYDEIVVHKSTDLRRIALDWGIPFKEIQELNPELLRAATPKSTYILRLPRGSKTNYQNRTSKTSVQSREETHPGPLRSRPARSDAPRVPERAASSTVVTPYSAQPGFAGIMSTGPSHPYAGDRTGSVR